MKKRFISIIVFAFIAVLGCGCGIDKDINSEYQGNLNVQIKGIFQLSNENLDMTKEELAEGQQFLFVVYDVENISDKNLDNAFSEAEIITQSENKYEEIYAINNIKKFLDNCGYETKIRGKELLGKSKPIRFISTYKINENDFGENATGKFLIDFDDFKTPYEYNYTISDIQKIDVPEKIFIVEDDEAKYLNVRTLYVRAGMVKEQIKSYKIYVSSGDLAAARLTLNLAEGIMTEKMGINLFGMAIDSSCFYNEQLACDVYPELSEKIMSLPDNIEKLFKLHDRLVNYGNEDDLVQLKSLLEQTSVNCDDIQSALK